MAMVAAEMKRVPEYPFLPESNAVGQTGRDLRNQSETDLANLAKASVFWRRILFLGVARQKIYELASLKSNWDSYGAPSPDIDAIENAVRILELMQPLDLETVSIVPSAEGGIGFCFKRKDRYADIETSNGGAILGVRYVGMETPFLIDVDGSDNSIKTALEQIRNHIGT
jgi:hypothetical protein